MDFYTPDFEDGENLPVKFTCDGDGIIPELHISEVPEDAESLVVIVDDPDAPGGDFVHWMVWNLPPSTGFIVAGELPEDATEGFNDFGEAEYGAPCPPYGKTHRYQFKLYALDVELELEEDATKKDLEKEIAGHILDEVMFVGHYQRQ